MMGGEEENEPRQANCVLHRTTTGPGPQHRQTFRSQSQAPGEPLIKEERKRWPAARTGLLHPGTGRADDLLLMMLVFRVASCLWRQRRRRTLFIRRFERECWAGCRALAASGYRLADLRLVGRPARRRKLEQKTNIARGAVKITPLLRARIEQQLLRPEPARTGSRHTRAATESPGRRATSATVRPSAGPRRC